MARQSMKWMVLGLVVAMMLVPGRIEAVGSHDQTHVHAKQGCFSPAMVQLRDDMRKLWSDHVIWTRSYIVSAIAGLPDRDKVLVKLLINQQDIGNAIKPYYGEAAGNKLADLLKEHILLAGKVLEAAKSGNQTDLAQYNKEWYRNADEMAKFLSSANPNWSEKELRTMLHRHLQLITDAVSARIKGDWDADILAFDQGYTHILKLADVLSEGIIKQFPKKFK